MRKYMFYPAIFPINLRFEYSSLENNFSSIKITMIWFHDPEMFLRNVSQSEMYKSWNFIYTKKAYL